MSRSDYVEDDDSEHRAALWRGTVASAIRGQRGQKFLRDMLAALDAMPRKRLIREALQTATGEVCALGAVGLHRGIPLEPLDPEDPEQVAEAFGVSHVLVREVAYENDEACAYRAETPEELWARMRAWVVEHLKP